jgi:hypothetical protein
MIYKVKDKIISKKPHACGNNEWEIARVGADIKLKCLKCDRSIFLSVDEVKKMTKVYAPYEEQNG